MIRISTSWTYQQSLNTMLSQQSALADTQNQVSSGKRIGVASDDPAGAAQVVTLGHILADNTQYSSNIDSANTRLSTEANALDSVTSLLNNANDLGLQAINGALSASDRNGIATQLVQIRNAMVQLANTTDANGAALFAGTSTTSSAFTLNASGTVTYNGNDAQSFSVDRELALLCGVAAMGSIKIIHAKPAAQRIAFRDERRTAGAGCFSGQNKRE